MAGFGERSPSAHARQRADEIWEAQHAHPFVRGIGDGSLDLERFRWWVRQDYVYLEAYVRVLAFAAAKAPDLRQSARFARLAAETAGTEMDLHRSYAAEFGITPEQLEAEHAAPATGAYTDFLLRHAHYGTYPELIAAVLPCMWGFSEVGQRLAASAARPDDSRYAAWIDMYASDEFAELASWCRDAYDAQAAAVGITGREMMAEIFEQSSRHELAFWQAAWDAHDPSGGARQRDDAER